MITLLLNYLLLASLAHGVWNVFVVCLIIAIPWDAYIVYCIKGCLGNVPTKRDNNDQYHYVDVDGNGKIDWYEL